MKHFFKTTVTLCAMSAIFIGQTQPVAAKSISDAQIAETYNYTVEQVVEQKLGKGRYTYENLSSFSDTERYVLVEGDNCYLIYDNQLKDFLEFSKECNSIYYGMDKSLEKVYYSPTYYFYRSKEAVYDMYSQNTLSKAEINDYKSSENNLLNSYLQEKTEKIEKAEKLNSPSRAGISVRVNASYYFENLDVNYGNNTTGSCGYVALGMVLSYYDNVKNDNIIPESYNVKSTHTFSDYKIVYSSSFTSSPGIDDRFHKYLIDLGHGLNISDDDDGTNSYGISNLADYYLNYIGIKHSCSVAGLLVNKAEYCRTIIGNGSPVIISIRGIDTSVDPYSLKHAVVGYEYTDDGIYAHFGWKSMGTKTCISNYTIKNAFSLNLNSEEHVCSKNYLIDLNGCTGYVCPCYTVICNHENKLYESINSNSHSATCLGCGSKTTMSHNFVAKGEYEECTNCGFSQLIVFEHKHNFIYKPLKNKTHNAHCSCGYSIVEPCMAIVSTESSTAKCIKCKRIM